MKQEFTLTLEDIEYPVIAEGDTVTVNGRPFTVEVTEDGTVLVDGIAYDAALEGETATVSGESYAVEVSGLAVTAAAPTAAPSSLTAPGVTEAGAGAELRCRAAADDPARARPPALAAPASDTAEARTAQVVRTLIKEDVNGKDTT